MYEEDVYQLVDKYCVDEEDQVENISVDEVPVPTASVFRAFNQVKPLKSLLSFAITEDPNLISHLDSFTKNDDIVYQIEEFDVINIEEELEGLSISCDENSDISKIFSTDKLFPTIHSSSNIFETETPSKYIERTNIQDQSELLKSRIRDLQNENENFKTDIERIVNEKDEEITKIKKFHEQQIDKYKSETLIANDKCLKLERLKDNQMEKANQVDTLYADIKIITSQRDEFEKKSDKIRQDLEAARADANKLRMELSRQKSEVDIQEQKRKEENLRQSSESGQKIFYLEQRINELEMDVQKASDQLQRCNSELFEQNQTKLRSHEQLIKFESQIGQMESENTALRRRINESENMERELSQLRRRNAVLEQDISQISSEKSFLNSQVQTLQQQTLQKQQQQQQQPQSLSKPMIYEFQPPAPPSYGSTPSNRSHNNGYIDTQYSEEPMFNRDYDRPRLSTSNTTGMSTAGVNNRGGESSYLASKSSMHSYNSNSNLPPAPSNYGVKSLASLVGNNSNSSSSSSGSHPINDRRLSSSSANSNSGTNYFQQQQHQPGVAASLQQTRITPFATEQSTSEFIHHFEDLDRKLTTLMTEKTSLTEESERLRQRGCKTLKERSRFCTVEKRLEDLGKEISGVRKSLAGKPH